MVCVIQVLMLLYVVYDLPANPLDPSYVPTKTPKHFHRMHLPNMLQCAFSYVYQYNDATL